MAYGKRRGGLRKKRGGLKRRAMRRGVGRANGGKITALKTATVPDRIILKMKYIDNIVLSGLGGSSRVFRLNSLYDPDTSVTNGHQPMGFDQWNTFYSKYRVFRADVVIKCANASSNAADTEQVAFVATNDDVVPSPGIYGDGFFEQPHCKRITLSGRGGMDRGTIKYTVNLPRILGMAPVVYKSNPDVASLFNNNPLEQVYGVLACRPIDGSSTALVNCEVSITYYAELFDRETMNISYPAGKNPELPGSGDGRVEDL